MSEENVAVVREAFLAFGAGDPRKAQSAAQRIFHSAIEWDMSGVAGWPEKRVYRAQEVGAFLQAWADSWRDWRFDVEEVREAGDEGVFSAIHEVGIGLESGASVDQHRYFATTVRGGRIVRVRMFSDRTEALEAAGLSE